MMSPESLPEPERFKGDWAYIGKIAGRFFSRIGRLGGSASSSIVHGIVPAEAMMASPTTPLAPNVAPLPLTARDKKDLLLLEVTLYPHEFNRLYMMAQSNRYEQP